MKKDIRKFILASVAGGFGMWVVAGFWHNLVLPQVNKDIQPHHDGLGLMLVAYFILAALMTYMYTILNRGNRPVMAGLKLGILVGVLWVFPHGIAMAGAHGTSVGNEIKNAIWHMVEQGIGGVIIAFVFGKPPAQQL